jgi:hypothetical protein
MPPLCDRTYRVTHRRGVARMTDQQPADVDRTEWREYRIAGTVRARQLTAPLDVDSLEGPQHGEPGDYLIENRHGERSIRARAVFETLYEPVH